MSYSISLPENYERKPLPGLNEWVAALRSGKYKQAQEALTQELEPYCFGYCCLGVLSLIQGRLEDGSDGGEDYDTSDVQLSNENPLYPYLVNNGDFPEGVHVCLDGHGKQSLATCNDGGASFEEIAEIIEKVWVDAGELLKA